MSPEAPRPTGNATSQIVLLTALFWTLSYALLSLRAAFVIETDFDLFSERRLLATVIGAALAWASVTLIVRRKARQELDPLTIISILVPAAALMLMTRSLLDLAFQDSATSLHYNVRWVLVWTGYFGLWLCLCLALIKFSHNDGTARVEATWTRALIHQTPSADVKIHVTSTDLYKPYEWLIGAMVRELMEYPAADRTLILNRLMANAGYERADELDPDYADINARAALVRHIASRIDH